MTEQQVSHARTIPGPVALIGGAEFLPGNEGHDRVLVAAADRLGADRPAFVIATAAARQEPDAAVRTAVAWYASLGLALEELPVRGRGQANSEAIAARARDGRFFVFTGGDPGLVVRVLDGSLVWAAIREAWANGAVLAGSSAGAMALGEWTLIRARVPGDARREPRPALAVVPGIAVLPHFETFGHRWAASARAALPQATLVGVDERSAALWVGGRWQAAGAGGMTVIRGSRSERFEPGDAVDGLPDPIA
jgi:cyanophycinase